MTENTSGPPQRAKRKHTDTRERVPRLQYLQALVTEFQDTTSKGELMIAALSLSALVDAKLQVLANLANFAYDPSNHKYVLEFIF